MTAHTDHVRALTLHADNSRRIDDIEDAVSLCPGARVYAIRLETDLGAALRLQDSEVDLTADDCAYFCSLPGLAWPAHARLVTRAGAKSTLIVTYGHCS